MYAIDDGPDAFVTWEDSDLSNTCQFATASDGQLRCLPGERTQFFADAGCTQATVLIRCIDVPDYGQVASAAVCNPEIEVYTLQTPSSGPVYESQFDGGCVELGVALHAAVDTVVAPDTFVAATDGPAGEDGELRRAIRTADDGACRQIGAWSTTYDAPVTQRFLQGATAYWLPELAEPMGPLGNAWDSNSCDGNPVAYGCADAQLVRSFTPTPTLYDLGAPIDAGSVFTGAPGSCDPYAGDASLGQWAFGPMLDPDDFELVTIGDGGSERVRARAFVDEDGRLLEFLDQNLDTERDEVCQWFADSSQQLRCFPFGIGAAPTYADDACTTPMFVDTFGITVEGTIPYRIEAPPYNCVAGDHIEGYEVSGAPSTVTTWYALNDGMCEEVNGTGDGYPLSRIPDSEFASATFQTL